jgi:hypothetical protein
MLQCCILFVMFTNKIGEFFSGAQKIYFYYLIFCYFSSVFFPKCEWQNFTPIQSCRQNSSFECFNLYVDSSREDRGYELHVATWILSTLSRLMKVISVCLCRYQITFHIFRGRGPGFDSRRFQIFWEAVGQKRGPLSLVSTTEELLGRNSSGSGQENRN